MTETSISPTWPAPDQIWAVADAMADAARAAILPHFRHAHLMPENKLSSGFDPVTVADRAAEHAMREILERLRPDDGIIGEELGTQQGSSGLTWVLDPIDGTRGFISGTPTWGVLIACNDHQGPQLGIIDQPYIGERFSGGLGVAQCAGPLGLSRLASRQGVPLAQATVFTTFPEVGTAADRAGFDAVAGHCKLVRYGCDCYAYALLAAGQIDLVIEAGLNSYDIAAPIAVIEAAGGVVTDWSGQPAHEGGRVLAAGSASLHAEALAILQQHLS